MKQFLQVTSYDRIEKQEKVMPLQSLVDYFNDRFEHEHRSSFRPFILEKGAVTGLFGPIRIDSNFTLFRQTLSPTTLVGHAAQIVVATRRVQQLYPNELENLLTNKTGQATDFETFINFDRLSRTVHMLNYLTFLHLQGLLFLEVDPRHILGIKKDHGAYFEEVITQCGLETQNIVITVTVHYQYSQYYQALIQGLENYRQRGYQIALKFENLNQEGQAFDLIASLGPNYVSLSSRSLNDGVDAMLHQFRREVASVGGLSVLQQIDDKTSDRIARDVGFDWVEGSYYSAIPFDYLSSSTSQKNEFEALTNSMETR
jgi:EAL domain-containing protein (putative c-di-GMP-specific phosphodiesterase class I)